MLRRLLWIVLIIAGCSPDATPTADSVPGGREVVATTTSPAYVEATAPVTLENVSRIALLGRLDTRDSASTVFAHAFSPDSTRLAGLNNEQLLAWDLLTGQLLFTTARQEATRVYYSPDKSEIYTVNNTGVVQVYEGERGTLQNEFRGHGRFNRVIAYFADEGWLALGGSDGTVKVWDGLERRSLVTFDTGEPTVDVLTFSTDGALLATGSVNGIVRVWNWREQAQLFRFDQQGGVPVRLDLSADGQALAVGTNDQIAVWSLQDGNLNYKLQAGSGAVNDVLAFSPDSRFLINGGRIADAMVWDAKTAQLVAALPGIGGNRVSAAFSADGTMLLASVLDGPVTLWDLTQITSETVNRADLKVGGDRILFVDWTPDSFLLAFFDATGPIYLWGIGKQESAPG